MRKRNVDWIVKGESNVLKTGFGIKEIKPKKI